MSRNALPPGFTDLEVFVAEWGLGTQGERERKRRASTTGELKTLYDVLLPRMDPIVEYLNELELGRLPADATRLFFLTLSFAEIAPFIECYKGNPRVANSFEETRFVALHADRPA